MKSDFKNNLRSTLDSLDLTVKELSERTGIPKGTLDCYLGSRASMPPVDIAARIANVLDVSVEYLMNGQEIKSREKTLGQSYCIGAITQVLVDLNEKDLETILNLSRVLKLQAGKSTTSEPFENCG